MTGSSGLSFRFATFSRWKKTEFLSATSAQKKCPSEYFFTFFFTYFLIQPSRIMFIWQRLFQQCFVLPILSSLFMEFSIDWSLFSKRLNLFSIFKGFSSSLSSIVLEWQRILRQTLSKFGENALMERAPYYWKNAFFNVCEKLVNELRTVILNLWRQIKDHLWSIE